MRLRERMASWYVHPFSFHLEAESSHLGLGGTITNSFPRSLATREGDLEPREAPGSPNYGSFPAAAIMGASEFK